MRELPKQEDVGRVNQVTPLATSWCISVEGRGGRRLAPLWPLPLRFTTGRQAWRLSEMKYELSLVRMPLVCPHLHTPPALFQGGWGAWMGREWPMTCHCTHLNDSRAHTTAHARTEESPPREHRLQSHQPRHTHERAQHHQVPCMLQAGAKGLVT